MEAICILTRREFYHKPKDEYGMKQTSTIHQVFVVAKELYILTTDSSLLHMIITIHFMK